MTGTTLSSVPARVGNVLLTGAAIAGVVCIALVIASFFFNISLIMFKTGSMDPTIPSGSLAVVREIPAAEVKVGDIVTVDRPEALPITHRVTSIVLGSNVNERIITMKGDANELEDSAPYRVETVRLTLAHLPGLAHIVAWFGTPWVLGGVALAASILVTWAFWPREDQHETRHHAGKHTARTGSRKGAGAVAAITILALTQVAPSNAAHAAGMEDVISGRHLTLVSVAENVEAMTSMSPGDIVPWQVGVSADAAEPGTVTMGLSGTGSGLAILVRASECPERWINNECATSSHTIRELTELPLNGSEFPLTSMPSTESRWLLIEVAIPDSSSATQGSATLRVTAVGIGDALAVGHNPNGPLAQTGGTILGPLLTALGAIGLGLVLAALARDRRKRA